MLISICVDRGQDPLLGEVAGKIEKRFPEYVGFARESVLSLGGLN